MDIYYIFMDYSRNHFAYAIETNAKNISSKSNNENIKLLAWGLKKDKSLQTD